MADPLLEALRAPAQTRRLDNGLRLVALRDPRAPLVAVHLQTRAGAAWDVGAGELPAVPGLAHLVEHMLFAGTARAPEGRYDALLGAAGAENNAWTEHQGMALSVLAPVEALDLVLALEADRMAGLDAEAVARQLPRERRVIAQERSLERDRPGGHALLALRAVSYGPGHPLQHGVLGAEGALSRVDAAQILAFHARAFAPEATVLALVGDIEPAQALDAAARAFGAIPSRPGQEGPPLGPEATRPARRVFLDDVDGVVLYATWPLPGSARPEAAAAHLLADLLGQARAGARPTALERARRRGALEDWRAWVEPAVEGGRLVVELRGRSRAGPLLRALQRARAELVRGEGLDPRLDEVRARWRSWAVEQVQDPQERAEALARCVLETGEPDCFRAHVERHLAVQPPAVREAAARWMADPAMVLLEVRSPHRPRGTLHGAQPLPFRELP